MTINLSKTDLINLVKGIKPSYDILDNPLIKNNGYYIGGFVDNWYWNNNLENLSEEQLFEIYQLSKNSWSYLDKK